MRTRPLRRIERERVRGGIVEGRSARRAHQVPAVEARTLRFVIIEGNRPFPLPHRLLKTLHQPLAHSLIHHEAVHHQVDVVYLVTIQVHAGGNLPNLPVHTHMDVSLFGERFEQLAVMPLPPRNHRSQQRHLPSGGTGHDEVGYLSVGIVHHLLARHRRIGPAGPRKEQAQEVVERGFLLVVFCSIATTGLNPVILSTSGRSMAPTN